MKASHFAAATLLIASTRGLRGRMSIALHAPRYFRAA